MKFIHTADWHLGNMMHDIDRTKETESFLAWLKSEIERVGAQTLVIAGDVFDVVSPTVIARKMYFRFLASLLATKCSNIVIVGGNHDSGVLLDAPADLLDALNIKVVGSINGRKVEDLVVELKDGDGNVIGICCAVPFMRDLELEHFYKNDKKDSGDSSESESASDEDLLKRLYADVYRYAVELRGDRKIPIIATGHLYANGLSGRDSTLAEADSAMDNGVREVVGTLGNVDISVFPTGFDYVALGHIHYATNVAGSSKVWYSGSPFVMGFDEANYKRRVFAVDVESGAEPVLEQIEVEKSVRYEQFKGDLATLRKKLRDLDKELMANPMETYVDLLLTTGEFVDLSAALAAEESSKRFVVKRHRLSRDILKKGVSGIDDAVVSTKQYTDKDYFRMLIAKNMGKKLESESEAKEVETVYNKFIDLFNEAVVKAHENA